uniref:NADH-ubiquinone oxidoreductase chain 5 n=1 Tax=Cypridopsis vidua TaxID=230730 RepID=A0A0N7AZ78_9CRUS|nr:NADH dehydrogenase subunit 5 [Cypridopsis vidua]AJY78609.1 NADH dehydrogenase subunit 5 [Cypridopsis vidua]
MYNFSIYKFLSLILGGLSVSSYMVLLMSLKTGKFLIIDWEIVETLSVNYVYSILLDWESLVFLSTVLLISSAVLYYSDEYMFHEKTKIMFALMVLLFVVSMMFLIISPSLISVILGWDGLGLVSYLLVIYYQNYKSYSAGMITCLTNRIGDSALLVAMGWAMGWGSFDFFYFLSMSNKEVVIISIFIILAAMTKSAQIPFSSWLPAAMAAPTPVSALVHSSTLVTAGVYLLIRFFPLVMNSSMSKFLFYSGILTMVVSSLGAMYEMDLKKIIALSTLSQLGLMMTSLGMGLYTLAFFHLLTHALFKASLFLCAGSMIHLFSGSQDLRALKGVISYLPITSSCLMICSLSLGGTPFLAAFYSKDKIVEEALGHGFNGVSLVLLMLSIVMTMIYSFRLVYYISIESLSMNYELNYDSQSMCKSMLLLTSGGIMSGSVFSWILFDDIYDNLWMEYKSLILFMVVCGFVLGILMKFSSMKFLSSFMSTMWFFTPFSAKFMIYSGENYAKILFKSWDYGWNECFGPQGLKMEMSSLTNILSPINQGLYKMMLMILISLIMLIFILFY